MSKTVKLSDELIESAREVGKIESRGAGPQVEHWARIGRELEASGLVSVAGVRRLLDGQGSVQGLDADTDALYVEGLVAKLEALDGSDTRLLDELRAGGHPIAAADEKGKLVVEKQKRRARTGPGHTAGA